MKTSKFLLAQFIIFTLLIVSSGQNLFAEEIEELKEIKVTSSRDTLTAKKLPASLTIFTEEEIAKKQHQSVEDLLRGELGIDVVQSGQQGAQTSIFMRGQGSGSTLVIIDGIQANKNTTGAFDFGDLTLDNIERVEVLRGPQSIQWGADAMGGVINIVTKKGAGTPTHSLSFEGGSLETFRQSVRSSGAINKFDYSLSASWLQSAGISVLNDESGGTEKDGHVNKTFSTRLGYDFTPDTRFEFTGRYTKSNDENDDVSGQESSSNKDNNNSNNIDNIYISAPFETNIGGWWDLKINPNFSYEEASDIVSTENDKFINRSYTMYLQNNMEMNRDFSVLWGGEYEHKEGVNVGGDQFGDGFHESTNNKALFLQGIYEYQDALVLTAGFRHDIHSTFDDQTTYKFEAGYLFAKTDTRLNTAFSKGFRVPTLNNLFTSSSNSAANPNLKPETIKSFEIGVKQNLMGNQIRLGLTFFNSVTHNFILNDANFFPDNFGKFYSQGIETEVDLELPYNLTLSMRHTWNDHYLDEKTKSTNHQPGTRRPKHKFNANLSHNWNRKLNSLVGVFARSSAKGFDALNETKGFATVRAAFSYQYNKHIKLTLRGENLLDKDYVEVGGFGTAGMSGYGGFVYTFD